MPTSVPNFNLLAAFSFKDTVGFQNKKWGLLIFSNAA